MNASETATSVLATAATPEFNALCARAVEAGCRWVWDPEVDNVVGLVRPDSARRAYVVVYVLEDDFESDADFEEYVASLEA